MSHLTKYTHKELTGDEKKRVSRINLDFKYRKLHENNFFIFTNTHFVGRFFLSINLAIGKIMGMKICSLTHIRSYESLRVINYSVRAARKF